MDSVEFDNSKIDIQNEINEYIQSDLKNIQSDLKNIQSNNVNSEINNILDPLEIDNVNDDTLNIDKDFNDTYNDNNFKDKNIYTDTNDTLNIDTKLYDDLDNLCTTKSISPNSLFNNSSEFDSSLDRELNSLNQEFIRESINRIDQLFINKSGENITDVLTNIYNIFKENKNN